MFSLFIFVFWSIFISLYYFLSTPSFFNYFASFSILVLCYFSSSSVDNDDDDDNGSNDNDNDNYADKDVGYGDSDDNDDGQNTNYSNNYPDKWSY